MLFTRGSRTTALCCALGACAPAIADFTNPLVPEFRGTPASDFFAWESFSSAFGGANTPNYEGTDASAALFNFTMGAGITDGGKDLTLAAREQSKEGVDTDVPIVSCRQQCAEQAGPKDQMTNQRIGPQPGDSEQIPKQDLGESQTHESSHQQHKKADFQSWQEPCVSVIGSFEVARQVAGHLGSAVAGRARYWARCRCTCSWASLLKAWPIRSGFESSTNCWKLAMAAGGHATAMTP